MLYTYFKFIFFFCYKAFCKCIYVCFANGKYLILELHIYRTLTSLCFVCVHAALYIQQLVFRSLPTFVIFPSSSSHALSSIPHLYFLQLFFTQFLLFCGCMCVCASFGMHVWIPVWFCSACVCVCV